MKLKMDIDVPINKQKNCNNAESVFEDYISSIPSVGNNYFDNYVNDFWATFSDSDEYDTTHIVIESLE
mgnify:CR=1 FL=1